MKKIIRLTESDLIRLVKRVIQEQDLDFQKPVSKSFRDMYKREFGVEAPEFSQGGLQEIPQNKDIENVHIMKTEGTLKLIFSDLKKALTININGGWSPERTFSFPDKDISQMPKFKWFKGSIFRRGPLLSVRVDELGSTFKFNAMN
jgi:hypothetical protein